MEDGRCHAGSFVGEDVIRRPWGQSERVILFSTRTQNRFDIGNIDVPAWHGLTTFGPAQGMTMMFSRQRRDFQLDDVIHLGEFFGATPKPKCVRMKFGDGVEVAERRA